MLIDNLLYISVKPKVYDRIQETFRRSSTASGYLPQMAFIRDVLGDAVPGKLSEVCRASLAHPPPYMKNMGLVEPPHKSCTRANDVVCNNHHTFPFSAYHMLPPTVCLVVKLDKVALFCSILNV